MEVEADELEDTKSVWTSVKSKIASITDRIGKRNKFEVLQEEQVSLLRDHLQHTLTSTSISATRRG
jgi:hypothetical protein